MASKKTFALVNYEICDLNQCNPDTGVCAAVSACSHKIIKQIDGIFEPPIIFQDMCLGCRDCVEVCKLNAIILKYIS